MPEDNSAQERAKLRRRPRPRRTARVALSGYRRRLAEANEKRGRGRAEAMTVRHLRAIVAACPDPLDGARDRALVLLGFNTAGRRSELPNLLVSDVRETEEGLIVTVRYGKSGAREVAVPFESHAETAQCEPGGRGWPPPGSPRDRSSATSPARPDAGRHVTASNRRRHHVRR